MSMARPITMTPSIITNIKVFYKTLCTVHTLSQIIHLYYKMFYPYGQREQYDNSLAVKYFDFRKENIFRKYKNGTLNI